MPIVEKEEGFTDFNSLENGVFSPLDLFQDTQFEEPLSPPLDSTEIVDSFILPFESKPSSFPSPPPSINGHSSPPYQPSIPQPHQSYFDSLKDSYFVLPFDFFNNTTIPNSPDSWNTSLSEYESNLIKDPNSSTDVLDFDEIIQFPEDSNVNVNIVDSQTLGQETTYSYPSESSDTSISNPISSPSSSSSSASTMNITESSNSLAVVKQVISEPKQKPGRKPKPKTTNDFSSTIPPPILPLLDEKHAHLTMTSSCGSSSPPSINSKLDRQIKNREAALLSRKRKRERLATLETHAQVIVEENDTLRQRVADLEKKVNELRTKNKSLIEELHTIRMQNHLNDDAFENASMKGISIWDSHKNMTTFATEMSNTGKSTFTAVFMLMLFTFAMFTTPLSGVTYRLRSHHVPSIVIPPQIESKKNTPLLATVSYLNYIPLLESIPSALDQSRNDVVKSPECMVSNGLLDESDTTKKSIPSKESKMDSLIDDLIHTPLSSQTTIPHLTTSEPVKSKFIKPFSSSSSSSSPLPKIRPHSSLFDNSNNLYCTELFRFASSSSSSSAFTHSSILTPPVDTKSPHSQEDDNNNSSSNHHSEHHFSLISPIPNVIGNNGHERDNVLKYLKIDVELKGSSIITMKNSMNSLKESQAI